MWVNVCLRVYWMRECACEYMLVLYKFVCMYCTTRVYCFVNLGTGKAEPAVWWSRQHGYLGWWPSGNYTRARPALLPVRCQSNKVHSRAGISVQVCFEKPREKVTNKPQDKNTNKIGMLVDQTIHICNETCTLIISGDCTSLAAWEWY